METLYRREFHTPVTGGLGILNDVLGRLLLEGGFIPQ
jgi:hypothetical protein